MVKDKINTIQFTCERDTFRFSSSLLDMKSPLKPSLTSLRYIGLLGTMQAFFQTTIRFIASSFLEFLSVYTSDSHSIRSLSSDSRREVWSNYMYSTDKS